MNIDNSIENFRDKNTSEEIKIYILLKYQINLDENPNREEAIPTVNQVLMMFGLNEDKVNDEIKEIVREYIAEVIVDTTHSEDCVDNLLENISMNDDNFEATL